MKEFSLTPHCLKHFDFNTIVDHEIMRLKVHFYGYMLGFRFCGSDVTGNADMEHD
jgi:hypothetical protein